MPRFKRDCYTCLMRVSSPVLEASSQGRLVANISWRTLLLGGVYGLILGGLYGALFVLVNYWIPALNRGEGSSHGVGDLYVAIVSIYGPPIGAGVGALLGLLGGFVELLLLVELTLVALDAQWSTRVYRFVSVAVTILFWSSVNLFLIITPLYSFLSTDLPYASSPVPLVNLLLFWPLSLLPVSGVFGPLLVGLAFIHISYLVTGWVVKPPEVRSKALF
jgi:hypothetical protein